MDAYTQKRDQAYKNPAFTPSSKQATPSKKMSNESIDALLFPKSKSRTRLIHKRRSSLELGHSKKQNGKLISDQNSSERFIYQATNSRNQHTPVTAKWSTMRQKLIRIDDSDKSNDIRPPGGILHSSCFHKISKKKGKVAPTQHGNEHYIYQRFDEEFQTALEQTETQFNATSQHFVMAVRNKKGERTSGLDNPDLMVVDLPKLWFILSKMGFLKTLDNQRPLMILKDEDQAISKSLLQKRIKQLKLNKLNSAKSDKFQKEVDQCHLLWSNLNGHRKGYITANNLKLYLSMIWNQAFTCKNLTNYDNRQKIQFEGDCFTTFMSDEYEELFDSSSPRSSHIISSEKK